MTIKATRLTIAAVLLGASTIAASAQGFTPESPECIAPANPGGGWDFTCRQVGKLMQDEGLIEKTMQVVNLAGGGGGVAYAEVVNKRADSNDLIVAASSATTTRLAQGAYPGNTMDQVRWLASVGADYGIIAVSADSELADLPALLEQMKTDPTSISIAGGSAVGGWDHLKVLIAANAYGIDDVRSVKYIAFDGGGEAVTQLLAGSVQAFTGDASEAKGFVESGDIRVLAVLAPERLEGDFAVFPTAKEQGVDAIGANWRGFYAPGGMSDEAYDAWVSKIADLYASDAWKDVMANNGLAPLDLQGAEFEAFVADDVARINAISKEIGIIQ
ncbi:tripartite tricarboxylate transporter substrate binding protein [Loktanella salsilacus]|jgi:putative tricarboxylic transport membrane protein|uniref:Putative tricarboxylic transport membrane protein n=1 Tax=Loktanella salsilacus TaxID=195913 RepID=A0A1I4I4G5_9RHOB|nr:tripartite tricarboxylate transporter substrate-binding protein [Loktanella salsilacus]MBU0781599.1 tripartite tricarboxylate transporter substrate binding protein [Alphaproteobacteria bacterium]MBU0861575.1 tripartite tricarboxylate transporter substrate binding protein [Alphaproteobacteria bacterium]UTH49099.1 tripartite tricarboxylate transporter substrate binding protein [Loktanella salsilacus]SFL48721.1 putative tricarboxylic transport membrane protein [Loktanella salsilacus]